MIWDSWVAGEGVRLADIWLPDSSILFVVFFDVFWFVEVGEPREAGVGRLGGQESRTLQNPKNIKINDARQLPHLGWRLEVGRLGGWYISEKYISR